MAPKEVLVSAALSLLAASGCVHAQTPPAQTSPAAKAAVPIELPADYYAEPVGQPYDEEVLQEKQEAGWKWKEFRYTSLVYGGEPIRVHALYAVPDGADGAHNVPGIIMTHGVFGAILGPDARYLGAVSQLAKAGYAVLFFDWYPDYAKNAKPGDPKHYTSFGKLDYFGPETWMRRGDSWKESLHYQAMMAGRRGVSWLSARPEVDAKRIGATGASYGGIFSSLLAGIEPRIVAVSPTIYTTGFGRKEEGYNALPGNWTDDEMEAWTNRFDSKRLLAKRKIPILYTMGSADSTFSLSKAMDIYAAMNEPKYLNIGVNKGHEFWGFDQTVLFFDSVLKHTIPRVKPDALQLKLDGREAEATVDAGVTDPAKVEIAFAPAYEIDPGIGSAAIPANAWVWKPVAATHGAGNRYVARYPLPQMRVRRAGETLFDMDEKGVLKPAAASALGADTVKPENQGLMRAFALVTDKYGAVNCTPLSAPVPFTDAVIAPAAPAGAGAPSLIRSARLQIEPTDIKLDATRPAGEPRAALPGDIGPVGRSGYILWNWNQQAPSADLKTGETATPTQQIFAPFRDAKYSDSFKGVPSFAYNARGGLLRFEINGQLGNLSANKAWHGALPPGVGSSDEVEVEATDDQEHLLTFVAPAASYRECMVRVWARNDAGTTAVRYELNDKADCVFQFRSRGNTHVGMQITSQPPFQFNTIVGPAALFLD